MTRATVVHTGVCSAHLFGVEVNKEVARALYGPYSYSQHNDKVQSPDEIRATSNIHSAQLYPLSVGKSVH